MTFFLSEVSCLTQHTISLTHGCRVFVVSNRSGLGGQISTHVFITHRVFIYVFTTNHGFSFFRPL